MEHRRRRRRGVLGLVLGVGGLTACVGGGGALPDEATSWEGAPSSLEAVGSSAEGVGATSEPPGAVHEPAVGGPETPPGGGEGSGPAACVGTFICQLPSSDGRQETLTLTAVNGGCAGGEAVFGLDGTIRADGKRVGAWKASGGGLTITVEGMTFTCTRSSGQRPPPPRPQPRPGPEDEGDARPDVEPPDIDD